MAKSEMWGYIKYPFCKVKIIYKIEYYTRIRPVVVYFSYLCSKLRKQTALAVKS